MQNKRGVSAIVGTMLIVLLTIIAAGILWIVVGRFSDVNNPSSQDCLTLDLEVLSCAYGSAGCYALANPAPNPPTFIQVPNPYSLGPGIAVAIIRRNQGHGDLQTAKLVFDVNGLKATSDIINYDLPYPLNYKARKDLSGLKEFATADIATADVGETIANYILIYGNNPGGLIKATIAPVLSDGTICPPREELVPCENIDSPPASSLVATPPASCPICGNNICENGETPSTCPGDCPPPPSPF